MLRQTTPQAARMPLIRSWLYPAAGLRLLRMTAKISSVSVWTELIELELCELHFQSRAISKRRTAVIARPAISHHSLRPKG